MFLGVHLGTSELTVLKERRYYLEHDGIPEGMSYAHEPAGET
jgi:hypothetical protein